MDGQRLSLLAQRQIKDPWKLSFQQKLHVTDNLVQRIGLEKELQGHVGSVSCLEWNQQGTMLASGSEDECIILWDPLRKGMLHSINTGHRGNIFSIKFLPSSGEGVLVSGAADAESRVHHVEGGRGSTLVCSCHRGWVKRLAVAPSIPFLFWSAAEDGLIRQFDMRVPHLCSDGSSDNVLIDLTAHGGGSAQAKCLALNPLRPELLAVGANDPFVRLYDRRMIPTTTTWRGNVCGRSGSSSQDSAGDRLPPGCVRYFVPGHLPPRLVDFRSCCRTVSCTHLSFSPEGTEILANLGGEQIYLFHIQHVTSHHKTFRMLETHSDFSQDSSSACRKSGNERMAGGKTRYTVHEISDGCAASLTNPSECQGEGRLPATVEAMKGRANEAFVREEYMLATSLYNQAIARCPQASVLYACRAAALIQRDWVGDTYAALRDCERALDLDSGYAKAHFHLATCLYNLHWHREALGCLQAFKRKFPELARSHTYQTLDRDIRASNTGYREIASERTGGKVRGVSGGSKWNWAEPSGGPRCCGLSSSSSSSLSEQEKGWRNFAMDYAARFCGHSNTTTDTKEANFFGSYGEYIVAGSDDGSFFIWDRSTTNIVRVLRGDSSMVNCLQPHPTTCLLATSGMDHVVRIWTPNPEDGSADEREVLDCVDAAIANQRRINADPLELMLMNMGYGIPGTQATEESLGTRSQMRATPCRTS